MKKFRVILATSSLLLAFCAAFASHSQSSNIYYEWRILTLQCVARSLTFTECTNQPSLLLCAIVDDGDLVLLRGNDIVQNQCGPSLFRAN
jgi:hypothetical protein